jgi:hypothetical protein
MADRTETDRQAARARLEARKRLFEQGASVLRVGGSAGFALAAATLRRLMPAIEVYAGPEAQQRAMAAAEMGAGRKTGAFGLDRRQQAILVAAGTKALLELLEITSVTHPVYADAPAFRARDDKGEAQAPHLLHLMSLVAACREYFGFDGDEVPQPQPQTQIAADRTVLYLATAPGEYAAVSGPQSPIMIRRAAMRQRSYSPPQPAILSNATQPVTQPLRMGAASQPMMIMRSPAMSAAPQRTGVRVVPLQASYGPRAPQKMGDGGCGCGGSAQAPSGSGSGCGCGCQSGPQAHGATGASPARYREDGRCAPLWDISCDTRWRLRACVKTALCDMLRCMADEVCEDGRFAPDPDLGACLEGFVCSLLHCLPDALCPPAQPEPCCLDQGAGSCSCNFAVGD